MYSENLDTWDQDIILIINIFLLNIEPQICVRWIRKQIIVHKKIVRHRKMEF